MPPSRPASPGSAAGRRPRRATFRSSPAGRLLTSFARIFVRAECTRRCFKCERKWKMSRVYTVSFSAVAVTVAADLFEIVPAANVPIVILGFRSEQQNRFGDANEDVI